MRKIPTLLVRDDNDRSKVTDAVTSGCEWVLEDPEARPTRKYDGTCTMFDGTHWWARREVRQDRPFPEGYVIIDHDPITEKWFGWEPIAQSSFAKFHAEAVENHPISFDSGTYELVGPKINGNPEQFEVHRLVKHGSADVWLPLQPTVEQIKFVVQEMGMNGAEGIVWHHPDGRMAKLKGRDLR